MRPDSSKTSALYKSFTYLLTYFIKHRHLRKTCSLQVCEMWIITVIVCNSYRPVSLKLTAIEWIGCRLTKIYLKMYANRCFRAPARKWNADHQSRARNVRSRWVGTARMKRTAWRAWTGGLNTTRQWRLQSRYATNRHFFYAESCLSVSFSHVIVCWLALQDSHSSWYYM